MATDYAAITNADELIDEIAKLADEHRELGELIKQLTVHAVRDLGAKKLTAAAAAAVSRPTLYAWLDEEEHRS